MSRILQQGPAPAQTGSPEGTALRKLSVWRQKDREHLADKSDRDAGRAEFRARQELRGAADKLKGSGQP